MDSSRFSDDSLLIESLFLRLASLETSSQLSEFASKVLPILIQKVGACVESERSKVLELLTHINKRLKADTGAEVPVEQMLARFQEPGDTFSQNFSMLYIKMGFCRLSRTRQVRLLPNLLTLLRCQSKHSDSLLQLVVPLLAQHSQFTKEEQSLLNLKENLGSSGGGGVSKQLVIDFILDVILLPYFSTNPNLATSRTAPAGMSNYSLNRVSSDLMDVVWKVTDYLETLKIALMKFLGCSSEVFSADEIALVFLVASVDWRHSVVSVAEMELKKLSVDYENDSLVTKIYRLYFGSSKTKNADAASINNFQNAADLKLRLRLIRALIKSTLACSRFPQNVQIVYEGFFGETNTNLRLMLLMTDFVKMVAVAQSLDASQTSSVCPLLFSALNKLISGSCEDATLKASAYIALGKIGIRLPSLVNTNINLLQQLFDSIVVEDDLVAGAIQDCLHLWVPAFSGLQEPMLSLMEALLSTHLESPHARCRLVAVKYIGSVFASNHVASRYMLCLACSDSNSDIQNEAKKILFAETSTSAHETANDAGQNGDSSNSVDFFTALTNHVFQWVSGAGDQSGQLLLASASYLRTVLLSAAGILPSAWPLNEETFEFAPKLSKFVSRELHDVDSSERECSCIVKYGRIVARLCCSKSSAADVNAWRMLREILAVTEFKLGFIISEQSLDLIKENELCRSNDETLPIVAEVFAGCLLQSCEKGKIDDFLKLSFKSLENLPMAAHCKGLICSLSQVTAKMVRNTAADVKALTVAQRTVGVLDGMFSTDQPVWLLDALCDAFDDLLRALCVASCRRPQLLLVDSLASVPLLNEKLFGVAHSSKDVIKPKLKEKAIAVLGFIACASDNAVKEKILNDLMTPPGSQAAARNYVLSIFRSALVNGAASFRFNSTLRNYWTESEADYVAAIEDRSAPGDHSAWLLDEILTAKSLSQNRHIRQAAFVWLFVAVKRCSTTRNAAVMERLEQIQVALGHGLSETNDITQDVASKGLGIVYELGTPEQQKRLIELLVDMLTVGKRESLSTYQELCSLASDLNKPDLIYRFMHLANHQAIWNSKAGAAFGFSNVFSLAKEQLDPHLPKIIPRLYRYQYDPNAKVQHAMRSIWQAITADRKNTVEEFAFEIFADLLKNLTNGQWRVRESSCLAVADLISSQGLTKFRAQLTELWNVLFAVRDDIKESVRLACAKAMQTCSRVTVSYVGEVSHNAESKQAILAATLQCVLEKGLQSKAEEVRAFSLGLLTSLSKEAGVLLKPHLLQLLPALLECLSETEPNLLSYLAVRSTGAELEQVDSARIAITKLSPVMETINMCVGFVDASLLSELCARLCEILRSAVGLGTKAGCFGFITRLCLQCPREITPAVADKLLKALVANLSDRNLTTRKQAAAAVGYVIKFASDSAVTAFVLHVRKAYLESVISADRIACAKAVLSVCQQTPETVTAFGDHLMPLAFFGMNEEVPPEIPEPNNVRVIWEEIWREVTPGTEGGLRLYIKQIIAFCQEILTVHLIWSLKAQSARTLTTAIEAFGPNLTAEQTMSISTLMLQGLQGRTWEGKEQLLTVFGCLARRANAQMSGLPDGTKESIYGAVLKECHKSRLNYRTHALAQLCALIEFLELRKLRDTWDWAKAFIVQDEAALFDSDEDDKNNQQAKQGSKNDMRLAFLCAVVNVIAAAAKNATKDDDGMLCEILVCLSGKLSAAYWTLQLALVKALRVIVGRNSAILNGIAVEALEKLIAAAFDCYDSAVQKSLRIELIDFVTEIRSGSLAAGITLSEELNARIDSINAVTKQV